MLERQIKLRDGEEVRIRPLKPEDAALYPDFLADVTPDDLRLRFFAPLGVVRLHDDSSGEAGEFAILVRSHLKGHGLGWLLMKHVIAFAQEKGLHAVHGQVLAENTTMLKMCEELGFHVADGGEPGVKTVRLSLHELPSLIAH